MDLATLPGFRDFFPEQFARREYIFRHWRRAARRHGFLPYDAPPLEPTDLYRRKSGDEIVGQLYCFTDKGGREVALRPEMTPSLARMIAAHGQQLPKPIKWFSIPQLFRYERQQRGRLREHFQFNCDIIGEPGVEADAELVALLVDCLASFGLTEADFVVRVSDRKLLTALLEAEEIHAEAQRAAVFAAMDKLAREPRERTLARMAEAGITAEKATRLLQIFHAKSLEEILASHDAFPAVCERVMVLQRFFGLIEVMGLRPFVALDLSIVRGLAYYTGIVFEAFDRKGELRAISGGGRYDDLLKTIGDVDLPALGFGMGDVVLGELLTERNLWPANPMPSLQIFAVLVEERLRPSLLALVRQLRQAGFSVDYALTETAVGRQFRTASQRGALAAVVVAPEEMARGVVKLKDLASRDEREIPVANLKAELTELFGKKLEAGS